MIEPHPTEPSIIVNYKLEAAVYGDKDVSDPMLADKKVRSLMAIIITTTTRGNKQMIPRQMIHSSFLEYPMP